MTDDEIIKGLECCVEIECEGCKYEYDTALKEYILHDCIRLIDQQKAEIERLKNELHGKVEYIHEQREVIDEKKAEIERLQTEKENLRCVIEDLSNNTEYAKTEAIKDFAERLKRKRHNYFPSIDSYCVSKKVVLLEDIVSLSKEMKGEEDNG